MIVTASEFATKTGTQYAEAANTLKFLVATGVVKDAGKRPRPDGRGKPSNLFDVPTGPVTVTLIEG